MDFLSQCWDIIKMVAAFILGVFIIYEMAAVMLFIFWGALQEAVYYIAKLIGLKCEKPSELAKGSLGYVTCMFIIPLIIALIIAYINN